MRVAVIGGGSSGLVTLKYLITAHKFHPVEPIEARLFEARDSIAGSFRHRVYEDAELVSSKYLTAFSDFRHLPGDPDFLSTNSFCLYLDAYAAHFNLWPHISLSTKVESVKRCKGSGHIINFSFKGRSESWECDAIAVCSGLHTDPYIPPIPGIEHVPRAFHSAEFRLRKDFGEDKHVLILGAGETAMDLGYLAVTSPTKSVTICHRDGFYYAPKVVPVPVTFMTFNKSPAAQKNIPTDTTHMSLFDTAYVHPVLQLSPILWNYYDYWSVKFGVWLVSGTKHGLDQWAGGISDERFHASAIFPSKSGQAVPYISAQYRKYSLLDRIRASICQIPIKDTGDRKIDLAPWPKSISSEGVVKFTPTSRLEAETMRDVTCKPDIVIYATGYSQRFSFLDSSYGTPLEADRRGVWKTGDESVGFIGFVRPAIGAIPPLAELQAQLWVLSLLTLLPDQQPRDIDYKLYIKPGRREYEKYGVDHESYAYQLALDMGSAASFTEIIRLGFRTTFTWAFGSNFNTKFRLVGPWRWEGATEIMKTELWDVVKQSGGWVYIMIYGIIPFVIFGLASFVLWLAFSMLDIFRFIFGFFGEHCPSSRRAQREEI
ncbi:FAD/NAD(P)-binding domain-containing protein [Cadophora sp. DSE1049]|nr:FAD/NAD(P)-binding domain-containing protein [Cadophora sp. DSE1049]